MVFGHFAPTPTCPNQLALHGSPTHPEKYPTRPDQRVPHKNQLTCRRSRLVHVSFDWGRICVRCRVASRTSGRHSCLSRKARRQRPSC